jgi:hypothetical protein
MKLSRTAIVTAVAALASAGALAVTSAGPAAAVSPPVGTGTTTCSAGYSGTVTFLPALSATGTSTSEEAEVSLVFSGCAGGTPVPVKGKYIAKGIVSGAGANNCSNWFAPSVGTSPGIATRTFNQAPLLGAVTWSPTSISLSKVRFNTIRIRTGAGTLHRLALILPNAGSGLVAGSYAPASNLDLLVNPAQNYSAVTTACSTGLSSLTIVQSYGSVHSTGTW